MRIHAIKTGTVAVHPSQVRAVGRGAKRRLAPMRDKRWTEPLPIYAWAIEHPEGLIVVDTGETARASQPAYFPRWHPYFRSGLRESVAPADEIGPQLEALGLSPGESRVLLTHLHTDHAGGLHHFEGSEIFVTAVEHSAAVGVSGRLRGYLPNRWPDWFQPQMIEFSPEPFGPFSESFTVTKAGDVHVVPTPGHSPGHASVVVEEDDNLVFLAGDPSYTEELMLAQQIDGIAPDENAARRTLALILDLIRERPTVYLPTHDPGSAERLAQRQTVATRDRVASR